MRSTIIALAWALAAAAQAKQQPPDPADARASVPPLTYRSVFDGYRSAPDETPAPWKQVNKEVEGAGMVHGGHAPPAAPSPPAAKEAPAARMPAHHGHPAHQPRGKP